VTYPRCAASTLAVGVLFGGVSAAGNQGSATVIGVREISAIVRDFAGVADDVLAEAKSVVNITYGPAGVHVKWTTMADLKRTPPPAPISSCSFSSLVLVNLLTRSMEDEFPRDVMGATVPAARYIRVAPHRIEQRADEEQVSFGFLLGQVLAHEFGHVLLPNEPHTVDGLMKATLDLRQAQQSPLLILPGQASDMRATIASHLSGC